MSMLCASLTVYNSVAKWLVRLANTDSQCSFVLFRYFSENRWNKRGIAVTPVMFGIAFTWLVLNQVRLRWL